MNDHPNFSVIKTVLYAGDTHLGLSHKNLHILQDMVKSELVSVDKWMLLNKLSINYSKAVYMLTRSVKYLWSPAELTSFNVYVNHWRNEVKWRPGQETSLAPSCSNLRSFGSKCIVLKKVLVTLLGPFGAPRSDSAPGELCPLDPPRYTPEINSISLQRTICEVFGLVNRCRLDWSSHVQLKERKVFYASNMLFKIPKFVPIDVLRLL